MKSITCFLFLFSNLNLAAQTCVTSGASIENVFTNTDGKYILVKDEEDFPDGNSKIFDAQNGKLLYKYPTKKPIAEQDNLGFTEAALKGFTGKNKEFIHFYSYDDDTYYTNKKYLENIPVKIEKQWDNNNSTWNFKFTWSVSEAATTTFTGFYIDCYYNIAENWGLVRIVSRNKKSGDRTTECYKLINGQEPIKVKNGNVFEINSLFTDETKINGINSMIYVTKRKILISTFYGGVYDVEKNKIIEKNIFKVKNGYLGATLKGALLNEDETVLAFSTYDGMTLIDLQTFKIIGNYKQGSHSDRNFRLPLFGLKSFLYSSTASKNIPIIKEQEQVVLCDPNTNADEKNYQNWFDSEVAKNKGNATPYVDKDAITYEKTVTAYNELLGELAASDRNLNPMLQKIMNSGKDAWILYSTRADAHKLLNNQASSIREFIKTYKAFITQNTLDSLYARLTIIEQVDKKF